jgi:glycosyltransferase involved in cell wall biosynthesis
MTSTLRIGFDAKRAFFNQRGLGNYSRDTIRILGEQFPQNNYILFTPRTENSIFFKYHPESQIISPDSFFYKKFSSLWRSRGMLGDIRNENLDIYHGLSHELPYGIEKEKIRTVVTMHDVIFLKNPELFPFFDRYSFRKKYVHSCRIADRIIAISQQTKEDIIQYIGVDPEKIDVVYQGCNPAFHTLVSPDSKKKIKEKYNLPETYMLIVGAIEKRKNHELIIEAMHRAGLTLPLVIVGRPSSYKNELANRIRKYSLQSRIFFLEDVETTDLPAVYQSAFIFIYPSFLEGFGIPILEALTSGIPVITSKGSCFSETGGNAAFYIDPYNPDELSDAIQKIADSSSIREEMIAKGYKHAQLFSDKNIAENLMQVYTKTLSIK